MSIKLAILTCYVAACNSPQTRYARITMKLGRNSSLGESIPTPRKKIVHLPEKRKKKKGMLLDIKLVYYITYSTRILIKYSITEE